MFRIFFALPLIFLAACNLHQTNRKNDSHDLLIQDSIVDMTKIVQLKLTNNQDYDQILDMLDKNDLNSINIAVKLFQNASVDSLARDSMFAGFNDFFAIMANTYLENNDSLQNKKANEVPESIINCIKSNLSDFGMNLTTSEGEYYLEPEPDWLLKNFGNKLTSAYRDFLFIAAKEDKYKFAEDGILLIPSDSLIARIVTWENFISKYPGFISLYKAEDFYNQYMEAFLAGTDNSKVFDPSTNKLNESSKKAFETYIQKNTGRKSSTVVKEYYDLLKSSNFLYTSKVDSFMLEKIYN
jgi:hypothetical protein